MTPRELKSTLITRLLAEQVPESLDSIHPHLRTYIEHVRTHSGIDSPDDLHNIDEVAACLRFLRMYRTYDLDTNTVRRFTNLYESLLFSGIKGRRHYKMTPIQVFITAGIFLFLRPDGRRVVREAIIFIPRKFAKTTYLAALALFDFLFGDDNGEVHIVANAEEQAKIAYREAKALAMQLDPDGKQIRFTANTFNWKEGQKKSSMVQAHTAGGKTKDGAFGSLVLADEYGSASYVKDHCDMADALNVYESSMGPRLNPLTVITTTAGRVVEGPFEVKLRQAQQAMYCEAEGGDASYDWQFVLALHPDEWEYTDEHFANPRIHRKVNPHIGITVQSDYYELQWQKAQTDPEVRKEVVTKLFNQFISNSSRQWIEAEAIRRLQCHHRVTDLSKEWLCWIACDFSQGNDLCAITYFCLHAKTGTYFFDADAWIAGEQLSQNSNARLYEQWKEAAWLNVSPSSVIDEQDVRARIEHVSRSVRLVGIGYDPYDSLKYVNLFQTWLATRLTSAGKTPSQIQDYLKLMLQPVPQTWATFTASTTDLWDIIMSPTQCCHISPSPLIPWCFANCVLDEDKMGNVKPVKRSQNAKIDIAIGLLMGHIMHAKSKKL